LGEFHALGADVVAVSVDSPGRNAALAARWRLPFPIHSDPGGVDFLQPLDLWNPHERGGIGWPAVIVYDAVGEETWRYRSRDFADRPPDDDDLLAAVRELGLPALDPPPSWVPDDEPVEDPGALRVEAFGPYFRGIRFGVRGLASRLVDEGDRAEAIRMSDMAISFIDAWKTRREAE
jgi:hypothetical protein